MGKRDFEDATVELDDNGDPYIREPHVWKLLDIAEAFCKEPPPLDFVLPGLVCGTVGGLTSPGGGGKSFVALETGIAVACGSPTGDLLRLGQLCPIKKGRVLIIAAEDPPEVLWTRMHAIGRYLPESVREDVIENMVIAPCLGHGIDITNPCWESDLRRLIEDTRPRMIGFDTLTRIHSKDENSAQDAKMIMAVLEELAQEYGCAIVFLHHVSKAAALAGMVELQQAARGSSVFVDNARWLSFLATMSPDEAKAANLTDDERRKFVRWNINKQNYGPGSEDKWFIRGEGGVLLAHGAEHINVADKVKWDLPKEKKGRTRYKGGA